MSRSQKYWMGFAFIASFGLIDAAYLTLMKIEVEITGATRSQLCQAVSEQGCTIALSSPMSAVGPVPISLIGAVTYMVLIALVIAMVGKKVGPWAKTFLSWTVLGSILASIGLAGVSWANDSWCPLCIGLYAVNTALLILLRLEHGKGWLRECVTGIRTLFQNMASVGVLLLLYASLIGGAQWAYSAHIERTIGSLDDRVRVLLKKAHERGTVPMSLTDAPVVGKKDSALTLIKFSDFQCPYCKNFWESVEKVRVDRPDLQVAFRHYPLSSKCNPFMASNFHKEACQAAYAAACAQRQGKFWEMGTALYEHQPQFDELTLIRLANEIGADIGSFRQCLQDPSIHEKIVRDVLEARVAGIESTPGFLINGHRFDGALPPAALSSLLDALQNDTGSDEHHPRDPLWETIKQTSTVQTTDSRELEGQLLAGKPNSEPTIHVDIHQFNSTTRGTIRALLQLDQRTSGNFPIWVQNHESSTLSNMLVCAFKHSLGSRFLYQWTLADQTNLPLLRSKLLEWAPASEGCLAAIDPAASADKKTEQAVRLTIGTVEMPQSSSTSDMERVIAHLLLQNANAEKAKNR